MNRLGIDRGAVVAFLIGNRPEYLVCDIAIALLGAVKVPINPALPPTTVSYMLEDTGAKAIIVGPGLDKLAQDALTLLRADVVVVRVVDDADNGSTGMALHDAISLEMAPRVVTPQPYMSLEPVDARAPASIHYTGGTTGRPKGVVHSQETWINFHIAQTIEAEIRSHDRLLLTTPLTHAAGTFAQTALLRGATVLLRERFDAKGVLRDLMQDGVTWTFMVPTMLYRLLDVIGAEERHSEAICLETIVYGASPIAPARLEAAINAFGRVFIQCYGQTECPNWGTRLAKMDHDTSRPELLGSCGQPSIMAEVKIVDGAGNEVGPETPGEICLRTPYMLSEYHNNAEATAEKFLGDWVRTGDVGVVDEDGYVYLKDRIADMVITGGMNVYCREVEDVLVENPDVERVAVIGVPHDDWGESVHAIVVAKDRLDIGDLLRWSRLRLPAYACPKTVEVVAKLPETPLGKIDKPLLRAKYWEGSPRSIN